MKLYCSAVLTAPRALGRDNNVTRYNAASLVRSLANPPGFYSNRVAREHNSSANVHSVTPRNSRDRSNLNKNDARN